MSILLINGSPNRQGNTASLAAALLKGRKYETLNLTDYTIGAYGQQLPGDGLDAVEGQFDLIAVNPPIRAGKAVVYKLFAQSAQRLSDGGSLYVVMRKAQGAESAEKELKTRFARVETVERGSGYRVFRAEK